MIRGLVKALLLLVSVLAAHFILERPVLASDKQAQGQELIKHAIELTDLRQSGPYRLRWSLTVLDEAIGKREGTDVVTFSSSERWRRDLHMTGYDEVAVFLGHNMYRTRNLAFTPPSLRIDISGRLRNLPEALNYRVLRVFNRKKDNVESQCVYLQGQSDPHVETNWCFDSHTGLPSGQFGPRGNSRIEFSNYKSLGDKFVPGAVEVIVDGKQMRKAVLESADSSIDSAHSFDPPAGANVRLWCDDMERPMPMARLPMDIRPDLRSRKGLELKYEITVDASGKVTDVVPMDPKPFVDKIVIEGMRASHWYPATCDGTPVTTDSLFDAGR